jgi:oxygen-dependent protoporphyrinogen oxidase
VGAVAGELAQRLDITGDPIVSRVFRWTCGTPQHEVGHQAWCRSIEDRVGRLPGLFLVGSSYRATGIPDVVADARRVACDAAEFVP